jgi:DNA-binding Xre family transcriptional regulator
LLPIAPLIAIAQALVEGPRWQMIPAAERHRAGGSERRKRTNRFAAAKGDLSSPRAPYVQDARIFAPLARLLRLPEFTFGHFKYITANAIPFAPAADGEPNYPVLIFSHGRGGYRQHNTFQAEELASHGYIVAAIDHPYAASGVVFPDGRLTDFDTRMLDRHFEDGVITYLAQDAIFTLDQLAALNKADPHGVLTGRAIGIFIQNLSVLKTGKARAIRFSTLAAICRELDCQPGDILEYDPSGESDEDSGE